MLAEAQLVHNIVDINFIQASIVYHRYIML